MVYLKWIVGGAVVFILMGWIGSVKIFPLIIMLFSLLAIYLLLWCFHYIIKRILGRGGWKIWCVASAVYLVAGVFIYWNLGWGVHFNIGLLLFWPYYLLYYLFNFGGEFYESFYLYEYL
ncbi:hypothetical protein A2662_04695 [Candidatus Giovannonibacteria bacterium RIFCSPHIGHO2_01_FULL_45_33]|uniref:Uncharacterized protein n=1 Tax=Candidatus Giovannonibacteria bacterium RIFCSPLOWO2_01_FULL_45_34 TaxID=1798351 RepID=A0A1F5X200_9BACT|nr:MAG: hypothetical protein A2662_04695 [Candidatus Giovannonibacteria bacterium RIFCSPHIGHO2_01_FULL_45_33]OGF69116.1 MAG: hypothetical protein A3C73_01335 [Candidatus Giovannonibacteria bacterium RIFCSPHIGHO2_02_FULL_44_11]OGF81925.1 MAG: hypothetical protein A2930_01630 [Candidatus Giovannonibacteria bacterium RIFCSPLOWO2_01_FULL_45_34]